MYVCVFMCILELRKSSACVLRIPGALTQLGLADGLVAFVSIVTKLSLPPATQVELSITLVHSQPHAGLAATNQIQLSALTKPLSIEDVWTDDHIF